MKIIKYLAVALLGIGAASCAREPIVAEGGAVEGGKIYAPDDDGILPGWVRIKFQEEARPLRVGVFTRGEMGSGDPELDRIAQALGATEVRRVFNEGGKFAERRRRFGLHLWYDVKFDDTLPVSRAEAEFASLPGVAHVQPIYKISILDAEQAMIPSEAFYLPALSDAMRSSDAPFDDPELGKQWHYNNDGSQKGWTVGSDINAFEAWKTTAGDPSVIVAVTDEGVQFDHPDLADNMWFNETELNGKPEVDDDDNGYIDDIYGWNTVTGKGEIHPGSHGTHVAGTVAAVNNNSVGVCGVAGGSGNRDGARIMAIQIYDSTVSGTGEASRPDAYAYAADNGAVISQNSWGYNSGVAMPQDVSDALDYFIANAGIDENGNQTGPMKGGLLIFAAGNEGTPSSRLPGADPRTVSVTGMCSDYSKPRYANYGTGVDIYAPGGADGNDSNYSDINRIYSTDIEGSYSFMWGTSMACPHVSGIAALIVSHYGAGKPGFTPDECREILLRSYRPVSEHLEARLVDKVGVGLVDAGMIFMEDAGTPPAIPAGVQSTARGNQVSFSWTVPADGNDLPVEMFRLEYTGKGIGKAEGKVEDFTGSDSFRNYTAVGGTASYLWTGKYNTEYSFTLSAVDRFGNVSGTTRFAASTGDYENHKPQASESLVTVEIESAGEQYARTIDLTEYFTDPDIENGDILFYSFVNRNEDMVKAVVEGNSLILQPLAKGSCTLVVRAADLDGEVVQFNLQVEILNGPDPVESGGEELRLYPNPVAENLNIGVALVKNAEADAAVYDAAARKVLAAAVQIDTKGRGVLQVGTLAPGVYSLVLSCNGERYNGTFIKR